MINLTALPACCLWYVPFHFASLFLLLAVVSLTGLLSDINGDDGLGSLGQPLCMLAVDVVIGSAASCHIGPNSRLSYGTMTLLCHHMTALLLSSGPGNPSIS